MLADPQAAHIKQAFDKLARGLTKEQLRQLYFCLDDLLQYGHNALPIAYRTISDLRYVGE